MRHGILMRAMAVAALQLFFLRLSKRRFHVNMLQPYHSPNRECLQIGIQDLAMDLQNEDLRIPMHLEPEYDTTKPALIKGVDLGLVKHIRWSDILIHNTFMLIQKKF